MREESSFSFQLFGQVTARQHQLVNSRLKKRLAKATVCPQVPRERLRDELGKVG